MLGSKKWAWAASALAVVLTAYSTAQAAIVEVTLTAREIDYHPPTGTGEVVPDGDTIIVGFRYDTRAVGTIDPTSGVMTYPFLGFVAQVETGQHFFAPDVPFSSDFLSEGTYPTTTSLVVTNDAVNDEGIVLGDSLSIYGTTTIGSTTLSLSGGIGGPQSILSDASLPDQALLQALADAEVGITPLGPFYSAIFILEIDGTATVFAVTSSDISVVPEPGAALTMLAPLAMLRRRRAA